MSSARLYLLDIEGTVAPISFVTEQLFPYAYEHFAAFLRRNGADAGVQADLALLAEENRSDHESGHPIFQFTRDEMGTVSALNYLLWLMDRDRKSTALKSLQGKIWKTGFESGQLKGMLFADVPVVLAKWADEAQVAIYSSGSMEAQQLLFRYSNYGDLTPLISAYFDTRTGPKTATASYAAIAAAMHVATDEVIFFSDAVAELDAARLANCHTRLVAREGNAPITYEHLHLRIESLENIDPPVEAESLA